MKEEEKKHNPWVRLREWNARSHPPKGGVAHQEDEAEEKAEVKSPSAILLEIALTDQK